MMPTTDLTIADSPLIASARWRYNNEHALAIVHNSQQRWTFCFTCQLFEIGHAIYRHAVHTYDDVAWLQLLRSWASGIDVAHNHAVNVGRQLKLFSDPRR
jgi:hypothetical protein